MNSDSAIRQPDEVLIARYEAQWRSGRPPQLETFLRQCVGAKSPTDELLLELIAIDLEYRWRQPNRRGPLLEQYAKRLPGIASVDDLPIWLIGEEYRTRQRFGDRPMHAEYAARFPRHGQTLLDELAQIDRLPLPRGAVADEHRRSGATTQPAAVCR